MTDTITITPIIKNTTVQIIEGKAGNIVEIKANQFPQTIELLITPQENTIAVQPQIVEQRVIEVLYHQGEIGKTGSIGLTGEKGNTGAIGGALTWQQSIPLSVWVIPHHLEFYPNVTTITSAGDKIEGDVRYVDMDNLTITYGGALSGQAFLS